MRQILLKLASDQSETSLSSRLRGRRFAVFLKLLKKIPPPVKILDVGGRPYIWEREVLGQNETNCSITIINTEKLETQTPNIVALVGDARNMHQFKDNEFDIVFSNSVIEHVGDYQDQPKMANEIRRIGKRYFVQTPNKYFPIEPHFIFPLFQFLPRYLQILLIKNFSLGNRGKAHSSEHAEEIVESIKLLDKRGFMNLFPGSHLFEEKIGFFVKSFVAYK